MHVFWQNFHDHIRIFVDFPFRELVDSHIIIVIYQQKFILI